MLCQAGNARRRACTWGYIYFLHHVAGACVAGACVAGTMGGRRCNAAVRSSSGHGRVGSRKVRVATQEARYDWAVDCSRPSRPTPARSPSAWCLLRRLQAEGGRRRLPASTNCDAGRGGGAIEVEGRRRAAKGEIRRQLLLLRKISWSEKSFLPVVAAHPIFFKRRWARSGRKLLEARKPASPAEHFSEFCDPSHDRGGATLCQQFCCVLCAVLWLWPAIMHGVVPCATV
jgi:hypothetical protein